MLEKSIIPKGKLKRYKYEDIFKIHGTLSKKETRTKIYEGLVHKVSFQENNFSYRSDILPCIYFYKFLAPKEKYSIDQKSRVKINIPDTIVYNDRDVPFWIFTGMDGLVYRTEKFNSKQVSEKLGNYLSANELVAVSKTVIFIRLHIEIIF